MKKSLILLAMVVFSVFFFTACGSQGVATNGNAIATYGNAVVTDGDAMVSGGNAVIVTAGNAG